MDKKKSEIDWGITLLPLLIVGVLTLLLMAYPEASKNTVNWLRNIFVNDLGFFYILVGLFMIFAALAVAFSRYGRIRLGNCEKPQYSTFRWGAMVFTSTMAADILYWSLIEWSYYYNAAPFGMTNMTAAEKQDWASSYPLFHWGPIPWSFYILPACAYAYMMYVKKRKRQTLSEACRPLLGRRADGFFGKVIDICAVVGLLAGTATTFSLTTPLLAAALGKIFGIKTDKITDIMILFVIGLVFIFAVMKGMKAISHLALICVSIFFLLLLLFIWGGDTRYLIETGITAIGNVMNNFFRMSTWMDPLRVSGSGGAGFPQTWTIFYWAYWIAWFVATPFFIASISEGRTIRQTILGGLSCGLSGTWLSFIVFGGFGLRLQTSGKLDVAGMIAGGKSVADVILQIFGQLPYPKFAMAVLVLAMIAFYSSTFDALTMVVAGYSDRRAAETGMPRKKLRAFWAMVFLLLPIGLMFSESTLTNLQTISIIAAFPLGLIMLSVVAGFLKELKKDSSDSLDKK